MTLFNGAAPAVQTSTASTAATQVFFTSGTVNSITIPSTFTSAENFVVYNEGPQTIYVGSSSVTAATGLPIAAGDQVTVQGAVFNVYAITSSGTSSVTAGLATLIVSE